MEDIHIQEGLHLSDFGVLDGKTFPAFQPSSASQGSDSDVHILSAQSSDQLLDGITPISGHSPTKDELNQSRHPPLETDAKNSALKALAGIGKVVSKSRRIDAEALEAIKAQRARNKAEGAPSHHRHSRTLSSDSLPPMPELTGTSLPQSQCGTSTGATTPTYPSFHPQRTNHRRSHSGIPFPPPSPINTNTSYPLTSPLAYTDCLSQRTLPELFALQAAIENEIKHRHAVNNTTATPPSSSSSTPAVTAAAAASQTPPVVDAFLSAQYNAAFGNHHHQHHHNNNHSQQQQQQQQAEHAAALHQALAAVASGMTIDPYTAAAAAAAALSGGSITPGSNANAKGSRTPVHSATTPTNNVSPLRQRQQHYFTHQSHDASSTILMPTTNTTNTTTTTTHNSINNNRKTSEAVSFPTHQDNQRRGYRHQRSRSHQLYTSSPLLTPDSDTSFLNASSSSLTFASLGGIDASSMNNTTNNSGYGMSSMSGHQQLQSPVYSTTPEFSFLGDLPSLDISGVTPIIHHSNTNTNTTKPSSSSIPQRSLSSSTVSSSSSHTAAIRASSPLPSRSPPPSSQQQQQQSLSVSLLSSMMVPKSSSVASPFGRAATNSNGNSNSNITTTTTTTTTTASHDVLTISSSSSQLQQQHSADMMTTSNKYVNELPSLFTNMQLDGVTAVDDNNTTMSFPSDLFTTTTANNNGSSNNGNGGGVRIGTSPLDPWL